MNTCTEMATFSDITHVLEWLQVTQRVHHIDETTGAMLRAHEARARANAALLLSGRHRWTCCALPSVKPLIKQQSTTRTVIWPFDSHPRRSLLHVLLQPQLPAFTLSDLFGTAHHEISDDFLHNQVNILFCPLNGDTSESFGSDYINRHTVNGAQAKASNARFSFHIFDLEQLVRFHNSDDARQGQNGETLPDRSR
jgi:hypothetical protein